MNEVSDSNGIRTQNHLVCKRTLNHLTKSAKCIAVLWVLISTVNLTVCYYHVIYLFQSESTFSSCLNVKELLAARNRLDIWSLSDSYGIRTHKHLFVNELTSECLTSECRFTLKSVRDMILTYSHEWISLHNVITKLLL